MTLGKKIQFLRQKKKLSQKDLAEKLNIATGTLQQYELDKREPKIAMLNKIAEILDISMSMLISNALEFKNDSTNSSCALQVQCDVCHFTYSPSNRYQIKEHQEYHKKYKQAFDKFGKFLDYKEADTVLERVRNVLNSKDSTEDEIYNAIIDGFEAEFSKSLYRSGLDINHVDYNTYCRYELEKSFYVDDIPSNVYFRLLEKYSGPHLTPFEFYPVRCYKEEPSQYSEEAQQQKYLESAYSQLNFAGRNKAIELLELLTKIPEYLTEEEIEFRKIP
ncbi:helix-turn-helix domain-containing protein [Parablautia sp. Marseille-Q6255]|uniref:helix-turn-helix domain-containing protein n=1 Tax=Parablautia sp. Marseille-Q6255 TaxID=3039593 RepID=UPI0024BC2A08|nr:helix-turn-helix domain-containing protein [Parablautia sp. Marseille-Q6255]